MKEYAIFREPPGATRIRYLFDSEPENLKEAETFADYLRKDFPGDSVIISVRPKREPGTEECIRYTGAPRRDPWWKKLYYSWANRWAEYRSNKATRRKT